MATEEGMRGIRTVHILCQIAVCTSVTDRSDPGPGWTRDGIGQLFCPAHPVATACRICGDDKGEGAALCGPCDRGEK